jgi:hypothetical protein
VSVDGATGGSGGSLSGAGGPPTLVRGPSSLAVRLSASAIAQHATAMDVEGSLCEGKPQHEKKNLRREHEGMVVEEEKNALASPKTTAKRPRNDLASGSAQVGGGRSSGGSGGGGGSSSNAGDSGDGGDDDDEPPAPRRRIVRGRGGGGQVTYHVVVIKNKPRLVKEQSLYLDTSYMDVEMDQVIVAGFDEDLVEVSFTVTGGTDVDVTSEKLQIIKRAAGFSKVGRARSGRTCECVRVACECTLVVLQSCVCASNLTHALLSKPTFASMLSVIVQVQGTHTSATQADMNPGLFSCPLVMLCVLQINHLFHS